MNNHVQNHKSLVTIAIFYLMAFMPVILSSSVITDVRQKAPASWGKPTFTSIDLKAGTECAYWMNGKSNWYYQYHNKQPNKLCRFINVSDYKTERLDFSGRQRDSVSQLRKPQRLRM